MFVYVLENSTGKQYVGMAKDPTVRLDEHNAGKTLSTKPFRPWKIIYTEEVESQLAARMREKYLKSAAGRRFRKQLRASSSAG